MGISWLHISDLHIYENSYYDMIKLAYKNLSQEVSPDFIVVTGDYCHYTDYPHYDRATQFLDYLVQTFNMSKNDFFLVPGNHDICKTQALRKECISRINETIEKDPDAYLEYMKEDKNDLRCAFAEYNKFVQQFYGTELDETDVRITSPSDVIAVKWKNKLNIIMINTALVSKNEHREVLDIKKFLGLKSTLDISVPSIVLAHHDLDDIVEVQRKIAVNFFREINAKTYLCGDKHLLENHGIFYDYTSYPIPVFTCGKSVPQTKDNYSDVAIILFETDDTGKTYARPYEWKKEQPRPFFTRSSKFDIGMNKQISFELFEQKKEDRNNTVPTSDVNVGDVLLLGHINNDPVKWKVIAKKNNKMLLLSVDAIAYKPFHEDYNAEMAPVNWNNCSLCKWLNNEFLKNIFGDKIKANKEIFVDTDKPICSGKILVENVSLLSVEDYFVYVKECSDIQKVQMHTSIVNDNLYHANGYVQWLLRVNGTDNMVATVLPNGKIDKGGSAIDIKHAIRPTMWIDFC